MITELELRMYIWCIRGRNVSVMYMASERQEEASVMLDLLRSREQLCVVKKQLCSLVLALLGPCDSRGLD